MKLLIYANHYRLFCLIAKVDVAGSSPATSKMPRCMPRHLEQVDAGGDL